MLHIFVVQVGAMSILTMHTVKLKTGLNSSKIDACPLTPTLLICVYNTFMLDDFVH